MGATGLAAALDASPPNQVTRRSVYTLEHSLVASLAYITGDDQPAATAAAAASPPPPPPALATPDGQINLQAVAAAVARHLQQAAGTDGDSDSSPAAVHAEAETPAPAPPQPVEEQAEAPVEGVQQQQQAEQAPPSGQAGEAAEDELPDLESDVADSSDDELAQEAGAAAPTSGRLGPAQVAMLEARGACDIDGLRALSRTNFSTLRSNVCVFKGRWQYEVQLGSDGIMQLGWTTLGARFTREEGVGDNAQSYAYDGRRKMRWHVDNQPYGETWAAGDTISVCIDMDAGTIRYARNGRDLGEAFPSVARGMPGVAYFAGLSLSFGERCEVNFGATPFLHPVEGYQPLQLPAPCAGAQLAAARYLAGCLSRLIDVSADSSLAAPPTLAAEVAGEGAGPEQAEDGKEEEEAAAAAAAARSAPHAYPSPRAPLGGLLPDAGVLAALEPGSSKGAPTALPSSGQPARAAAAAAAGPAIHGDDRLLLGALLAEHLGPLCQDAGLVEAVLLPLLDDTAGDLGGGAARAAQPGSEASDDEGEEEGGASTGAASEGGGEVPELGRQRLGQLLGLLGAVLEPEELGWLAATCCAVLARRVRGSLWVLEQAPATPALAALRLWSAMLDCEPLRDAWLSSPDWQRQLEDLLTVRHPTETELEQLMRNLHVSWASDGSGTLLTHRGEDTAFSTDLNRIAEGVEQIEAAAADILLQVYLADAGGSGSGSVGQQADEGQAEQPVEAEEQAPEQQQQVLLQQPAAESPQAEEQQPLQEPADQQPQSPQQQQPPEQQQQQQERRPPDSPPRPPPPAAPAAPPVGGHLHAFADYLLAKNHGAMRHVPPPGLSDPSAPVAVAFALLRLMSERVAAELPDVPQLVWDPAATFLRGGALGGGDDPYYDAGRLGGTLSHLAREHPPDAEDRRPLEGLPLGAVVQYSVPLRLAGRALEGPSFSDVLLRDRLLVLCHLSVAPQMREGLSHLAAMQSAMQGLRAMGGQEQDAGAGGQMLAETRRQCREQFARSLRAHEWTQCWLLSPWRQQAAFVLAVSTAQLVEAVSRQRSGGQLLRYVPELYVGAMLDMVHVVHRCEPAVLGHTAMLRLGLRHIVDLVVTHLDDARIVSPEVQARLLQMVLDSMQELDLLRELGSNEAAREHLMPSLMRLFGRPLLWGPVSNVFALLTEGCGFLAPPAAFPSEFGPPLAALRHLLKQACAADADLRARFLHALFDHANRMLTELVAGLESMDAAWTRTGGSPSPQLLRLLSSTADYAVVLLRTLEMLAAEAPQLFLQGAGDMDLARVAEVLGFAVPQFVSGRAHRVLARVVASRPMAARLRLREAHLLQPLAGTLLALWRAEQEAAARLDQEQQQQQGQQVEVAAAAPRRHSLLRALDRQAALTDSVLQGLAAVEMAQVEPLSGAAAQAAEQQQATGGAPSPDEQRACAEQQLSQLGEAVQSLLAARAASAAARSGGGGGAGAGGSGLDSLGSGEWGAEPPEHFLDPILTTLMQDPVELPDSRVCLDRATIERHLLSSATDPFSRAPLTKDQLVPKDALRAEIEAWVAAQRHGGPAGAAQQGEAELGAHGAADGGGEAAAEEPAAAGSDAADEPAVCDGSEQAAEPAAANPSE